MKNEDTLNWCYGIAGASQLSGLIPFAPCFCAHRNINLVRGITQRSNMKVLTPLSLFSIITFFSICSNAQITWQQTNGPEGGAISAVCVDSIDHVLISTKAGGIFESGDSGTHWVARNEGLTTLFFRDIEAGSRGYAFALAQGSGIGIFRWKRGDVTNWRLLDTTARLSGITAMAVNRIGDLFI